MSLKLFRFIVENTRTQETARFLGQGENIQDAFKDGTKNCGDAFRPSSSGAKRPENGVAVTLPDGRTVSRRLSEFEGDAPFAGTEPAPHLPAAGNGLPAAGALPAPTSPAIAEDLPE